MPEFSGLCVGGPLDGMRVTVTSREGFIATDRGAGKAWMYKRDSSGSFVLCVDHDDSLIYPQGRQSGERVIDWARLPLAADTLAEVKLGDGDEALSGDPVSDDW